MNSESRLMSRFHFAAALAFGLLMPSLSGCPQGTAGQDTQSQAVLSIRTTPSREFALSNFEVQQGMSCFQGGACAKWSSLDGTSFAIRVPPAEGVYRLSNSLFPISYMIPGIVDEGYPPGVILCGSRCSGTLTVQVDTLHRKGDLDLEMSFDVKYNLCTVRYCVDIVLQDGGGYEKYDRCDAGSCPLWLPCDGGSVIYDGQQACPNPDIVPVAVDIRAHGAFTQEDLK